MNNNDDEIADRYVDALLKSEYVTIVEDRSGETQPYRSTYDLDINTTEGMVGITLIASQIGLDAIPDATHVWVHDSNKEELYTYSVALKLAHYRNVLSVLDDKDVEHSIIYERLIIESLDRHKGTPILQYIVKKLQGDDTRLVENCKHISTTTIIRDIIENCLNKKTEYSKDEMINIIEKIFSN